MDFDGRKAAALATMGSSSAPDKSPKGFLDAPIVPLLDMLNSHPDFFTTSSCSGRISILSHKPHHRHLQQQQQQQQQKQEEDGTSSDKNTKTKKKKAGGGGWVYVSHDPADEGAIIQLLFGPRSCNDLDDDGELVFRFEPLIIAVECRGFDAAQALVSAAIAAGFRESGVTSMKKRVIIAIRCSIRLEVPLGRLSNVLVSEDYVRYLIQIANEKMELNRRRTDGFFHMLKEKGISGSPCKKASYVQKEHGLVVDKAIKELEYKQSDILLRITKLENDTLKNNSPCATIESAADQSSVFCMEQHREDKIVDASFDSPTNSCEVKTQNCNQGKDGGFPNSVSGLLQPLSYSFSAVPLNVVGEPVEKLFLWGHSASILDINTQKQVIIFGGFGGLGRHARRNYSLMIDPMSSCVKEIDTSRPPSPRVGHTSSVIGDCMYIIGGRGGPMDILNDVWVLNTTSNSWVLLDCNGSVFYPRHRHAAVAVGPNIYVFGGLGHGVIYSFLNILNTETAKWSEVKIQGDWPCARHSHALVAYDSQLFMFGGYDGKKALGDLYSFDLQECLWQKKKTVGGLPCPRFSHSMFIYKNYLGIVGGCPITKCFQKLSLLDLLSYVWMHITFDSVGRELWIRSSTCVIDDNIIIIGGGASCYAFGTKFNLPVKIDLRLVESAYECLLGRDDELGMKHKDQEESCCSLIRNLHEETIVGDSQLYPGVVDSHSEKCQKNVKLLLQVEKKYAKTAKDVVTNLELLDTSRRVQLSGDGCYVHIPISGNFSTFFQEKNRKPGKSVLDTCNPPSTSRKVPPTDEFNLPKALSPFLSNGASILVDNAVSKKKVHKTPAEVMKESVRSLLREKRMLPELLEQLPQRWERLGDIVVLPVSSFRDAVWNSIGSELWPVVARSLGAKRLARQGRILPTGTRDSTLEILVGDDGWVTHNENGISYSFDATKCMFSFGNLSEKLRMGSLNCRDEVVVDLFAGVGYFVLPFLVKANAKWLYACEWNPHALKALRHNVQANLVADRCIILEGDNRVMAPKGVADRVCLGLLPSSENSWPAAVKALRSDGGVLHIHGNVKDSEETSWSEYVSKSIRTIAQSEGLDWDVSVQHIERVKWYGPHIRHLVADVMCRQIT